MLRLSSILILVLCTLSGGLMGQSAFKMPKHYTVHRTSEPIKIDGKGDEASWGKAQWSASFVDIEGDKKPSPYLNTKMKMLWDDEFFYFYAAMEEPHIWATLKERDTVIFHDNDFEIFIDPDGDTHNYFEFEVNALNTVWDLFLTKPYRDGGRALNSWDIKGLKSAVNIDGTINDPSDIDKGWSVEVAIPWKALKEGDAKPSPPKNGNQWRLNFSRVQWETEIIDNKYVKKKNPDTGKPLPENNWVWTPQRVISMHEPEYWGIVSFTDVAVGTQRVSIAIDTGSEEVKQLLYQIHRNQLLQKKTNGGFSDDVYSLLNAQKHFNDGQTLIDLSVTADGLTYHAKMKRIYSDNFYWHIDHTGRIWSERIRH